MKDESVDLILGLILIILSIHIVTEINMIVQFDIFTNAILMMTPVSIYGVILRNKLKNNITEKKYDTRKKHI